jgi:hypothetical protein
MHSSEASSVTALLNCDCETSPSPEILEFVRSLPPGTIVAQLDNGELAVCADLEEAEQRFAETSQPLADRGWPRIAHAVELTS